MGCSSHDLNNLGLGHLTLTFIEAINKHYDSLPDPLPGPQPLFLQFL